MRRKEREVTSKEEIMNILDQCKVCRLGMSGRDGVYIVPMNHGYEVCGEELILYFHGAKEGKKIELLKENHRVGIEMDCGHKLIEGRLACQYSYQYASVIGSGEAQIVEDPEEKLKALAVIMRHQTGKMFDEFQTNPRLEKAVAIIKVRVDSYTCKKYMK